MRETPVKEVRPRRRPRLALILAAAAAFIVLGAAGTYLYLRFWQTNFHTVVGGQVYRSAQPSPDQLKRWARQYGLKSVLNLRYESSGDFYQAERTAGREAGVELIGIRLSAIHLPTRTWLRRLVEAIETAPRPMLIHCQAGADRTGVASALAAMAVGGQSYEAAKGQLSLRYLHVDGDPDHIGGLLLSYEEYCRAKGLGTGGWEQFKDWALNVYHPGYYHVRIDAPSTLSAAPGQRITVELTVTNLSGRAIPAGGTGRSFTVAAFSGSSEADSPDREYGPRAGLPKQDIAPGAAVKVTQTIIAPEAAGVCVLHFDVVEEGRTWFARQGSAVATTELTVKPPGD